MADANKISESVGQAGKLNRSGRPKGAVNKVTKQVKEMILGALDDAGGQAYLAVQARENPSAFMTLIGKVLPLQLTGDDNGGPVKLATEIRLIGVRPDGNG